MKLGAVTVMAPIFLIPGFLVGVLGSLCGQVYIKAQLSVKRVCVLAPQLITFSHEQGNEQCKIAYPQPLRRGDVWHRYINAGHVVARHSK